MSPAPALALGERGRGLPPRLRKLTRQLVGQERRRSAVLAGYLPPVGRDRPAAKIPQRETPREQAVGRTSVLS
jgi:hypothetical protein